MHKTLYIIGNGFDLHHGLNTYYKTFAIYLSKHNSGIHDKLLEYYGLPYLDPQNPDREEEKEKEALWSDFENALANLDYEAVLDDNSDLIANPASEDFRDRDWHAFQIEMEMFVDSVTTELFEAFRQFILQVEFPENIDGKRIQLNTNALFLSFNYTNTLERYYNVPQRNIKYIHGKALKADDTIVLGHAFDPDSFRPEEEIPPAGLSEEELDYWRDQQADKFDFSYDSAEKEILGYFNASYKQTSEIIAENKEYFQSLESVEQIFVFGHSLAPVDQPYFKEIITATQTSKPKWAVSYMWDDEIDVKRNVLIELGVNRDDIEMIKLSDLVFKHPTLF